MSGERMHAGIYHEVSGVCTHPDFQGKGLARRLMNIIITRQLARGEIPGLHVMSHNHSAHELYLRMGFVDDCLTPVLRTITLLLRETSRYLSEQYFKLCQACVKIDCSGKRFARSNNDVLNRLDKRVSPHTCHDKANRCAADIPNKAQDESPFHR